jgi:hypothetical protein
MAAARGGNDKIVALFMEQGASLPEESLELIKAIIEGGNETVLKLFHAEGVRIPAGGDEKIIQAMEDRAKNYLRIYDGFLNKECQCAAMFDALVEYGLNIEYEESSAWEFVKNSMGLYSQIRYEAKSVEENQLTRKNELKRFADSVMKKLPIQDINHQNYKGETLLIHAAKMGLPSVVEKLLALGADSTLKNNEGESAQYIALLEAYRISNRRFRESDNVIDDFMKTIDLLEGDFTEFSKQFDK